MNFFKFLNALALGFLALLWYGTTRQKCFQLELFQKPLTLGWDVIGTMRNIFLKKPLRFITIVYAFFDKKNQEYMRKSIKDGEKCIKIRLFPYVLVWIFKKWLYHCYQEIKLLYWPNLALLRTILGDFNILPPP